VRETRGNYRLIGSAASIAATMLVAVVISFKGGAMAQSGEPASVATCSTTAVKLSNQNSFPIWIGENVTAGTLLVPPGNNWELAPSGSLSLCLPADWTSGTFWARTECDFNGTFGQDPDHDYVDCTSQSDCCTTGNTCAPTGNQTLNNHICYGGKCVIDCSSGTGTNGACASAPNPLPNSVCVAAAGSAAPYFSGGSFCSFTGGVCKTGDCGTGLWQCQGAWQNTVQTSPSASPTPTPVPADFGPETPASQFEITDASGADSGNGAATYDVTNLAGYNNPIAITVTNQGTGAAGECVSTACNTDLNSICPSLLQVIEPPTGSGSCGGGSCATGACEACPTGADAASCSNGFTCVIGCNGPGKLCGANYPSPVSAPGVAYLECTTPIPSGSVHGIPFSADGSEYRDMYDAANDSGVVSSGNVGVTMFSGNQGTPTCWGDIDCAPGEECLIGPAATGIAGLPSYVGICATQNGGGAPIVQSPANCASTADEGKNCGGYDKSPAYTCVAATAVSTGVACLPAYNPPTVGLGTFDSISGFFEGIGAPLNPEWEAASLWAAGNGTTAGPTPYYETFSNACPHQYAWTYDDHTGGLACNGYPIALTVAFGQLSGSPTATPTSSSTPGATPTATVTETATATATATASETTTATPTPTETATPTQTATASASATTTATATSTSTSTATATLTPTSTSTSTATATATTTATPTATPTPSGRPTPRCTPNIWLSTNPGGTLAFPQLSVGQSVSETLTVTNNEPAGKLALKGTIVNAKAEGLSVIGGSCVKKKLHAGQSCTYQIRLKARKANQGKAISTPFNIVGTFGAGVCPTGDVQSVSVTLAGNIKAAREQSP
jgi:hypothetical protein